MLDLRSDTVTRPTAAMRKAMAEAEVGDDVFGEDPTVRRLEELTAETLGYEAALFVPTGTMGNQIALHLHARPGSEVICDRLSHVVLYEMAAMAALSGLLPNTVHGLRGLLQPSQVAASISPDVTYKSRTGVIVLENSHNMAGGTVYSRQTLDEIQYEAREHGIPIHLDGARLFNAAVASGHTVRELAAGFDSVMISLSKGLGAPAGSMLAGGADFVHEARRVRKMLGGGMRQVGVLAAAGLIALEDGPRHLAEDHVNARWLAEALAQLPGVDVDLETVVTNIVVCVLDRHAEDFLEPAREAGMLGVPLRADSIRFVTHRDAAGTDIRAAFGRLQRLLR